MNKTRFLQELAEFCEKETQNIIVRLQEERFANQGAFNGHEKWVDNDPRVVKDKGRNDPLFGTGELYSELTNPTNWTLKPKMTKNGITLSIPDEEQFTDSKYDILDSGGGGDKWFGYKGKIAPPIEWVPSRPFKALSPQDIDWIKQELLKSLKEIFDGQTFKLD